MASFWLLFRARIQQRWVFAIMGSLAVINGYASRILLSIAITEMVKPKESLSNRSTTHDICTASFPTSAVHSNPSGGGIYEWDEYTQGIILSSFYWGNILTQIPGGLLSARFGGKYVLGVSILLPGVLTLLTPIVVEAYGSTGLIVLRFVVGCGQGPMLPAIGDMIAQWAPSQERAKISTLVMSGIPAGTVIGNALSGVLIQYSSIGWPSVYYFFGSSSVLWFFACVVLCYSYPDDHPFITEKEKNYLREATSKHAQRQKKPTPWRQMMASGPLWALLIGYGGLSWGFLMIASDLPKYMSSVLKFSIEVNGYFSALPHLLTCIVSNAASWLADWLINSGKLSRTAVRQVLNMLTSVLSATCIVAASYAECDRTLVVIFFIIGVGMMGFSYPSLMVNPNDLSPNYSGTLVALMNTTAALNGILVPYVIGVLTPQQTLLEWRIVFWITFVIFAGSSLVFGIWGDAEVQHWNDIDSWNKEQIKSQKTPASLDGVGVEQSVHGTYVKTDASAHTNH